MVKLQDFTSPMPQTKRFFLTFACKCGIIFRHQSATSVGKANRPQRCLSTARTTARYLQEIAFHLFFAAPQRAQFHGGLSLISGILEQNGSLLFQLPRTQTKEGSARQVYSFFIQVESLLPPCGRMPCGVSAKRRFRILTSMLGGFSLLLN